MFRKREKSGGAEINASSMADIAFLLLIFFLVATTINRYEGMEQTLPKRPEKEIEQVELNDRNVFKVGVNSSDRLQVEENEMQLSDLKEACKEFLKNNGRDPKLSDNPQIAVVSFKAQRGTTYKMYVQVLNELKAAYHEVRAESEGITKERYLEIAGSEESEDKKIMNRMKEKYPTRLSIAEPEDINL